MLIKPEYRLFNRAPKVALAALTLAVLSACGDGALEGKNFISAAPVNPSANNAGAGTGAGMPTDPAATPSTPSAISNDPMQQAANNAANASNTGNNAALNAAQAEMTRIAIQQGLAQQEGPTQNHGKKMLVVGLDAASTASDNSAWLDGARFAGMTAEQREQAKATYVSLTGANLAGFYAQSCPVIHEANDLEMYRCLAGIYFGKNKDGNLCFTRIGWDGHVQHVNVGKIVRPFALGVAAAGAPEPTVFTHASGGGNTMVYLNGTHKSAGGEQKIVFSFDSGAQTLTIDQLNTDAAMGPTLGPDMEDRCTINLAGAGA
ncbi:MAG: hypothetical protein Q4D19_05235 [Lautropia sp.]|nr:hypothetical protein [Lautropia sp.]